MALVKLQQNPDNVAWSGQIQSSESVSDTFVIGGRRFVKVEVPTITSATLTFEVQSYPGGDFVDLFTDDGTEFFTGSATTGGWGALMPWLASYYAFRIRTGTSGSPVAQDATRTFIVAASTRG